MSYEINKTDGSVLLTVEDQTVNTDTSVTFIGRQSLDFGDHMNENFLHILENSSYQFAPANPVTGQLWYNPAANVLSVWNNLNQWEVIGNSGNPLNGYTPDDFLSATANDSTTGTITVLNDGGLNIGSKSNILLDAQISINSDDLIIQNKNADGDIIFNINDGGSTTTALLINGDNSRVSVAGDPINNLDVVTKIYLENQINAIGNNVGDLDDVTIVAPVNNDVIMYSTGAGEWNNQQLSLSNLNDVDTTGLGDGESLTYNAVSANWEPDAAKVSKTGDVISGPISYNADPTTDDELARKHYVDQAVLAVSGGVTDFPTGTALPFYNPSAPLGWTLDSTNNDTMMRIVNGLDNSSPATTGGGSGGTESPISAHTHTSVPHFHAVPSHEHPIGAHTHTVPVHSHSVPGHSHSVPSHNHSVTAHSHTIPTHTHPMANHTHGITQHSHTTGAHTLSQNQMPSHRHTVTNYAGVESNGLRINAPTGAGQSGSFSGYAGGNQGHSHSVNTGGPTVTFSDGGSVNTGTNSTGGATNSTTGSTSSSSLATNTNSNGTSGDWTGPTTAASGNTGTHSDDTATSGANVNPGFLPKYTNFVIGIKN